MSHVSLYRKYRPQTFDQVLGQDAIVQSLQSSLKKNEISHAYLFAGSRGTGKTSIARIFARELGVSSNDIYEIDAASNRGINEMKELLAGVSTLPFDSQYKVYILDEVHMFTKEAWNALLKTLEEPPAHVVFILATTELHKVLDTIKSRCQVFEFKKPTIEILVTMLRAGATAEGVTITDEALDRIARLGNGAFRDTWGIFERVMQTGDSPLTIDTVTRTLTKPQHLIIESSVEALATGDTEALLDHVHQIMDQGLAMDDYLERILEHVRMIVLYRFAPTFAATALPEFSDTMQARIKEWAGEKNVFNAQLIAELLTTLDQVKKSSMPNIPVELAFLKILGNNS